MLLAALIVIGAAIPAAAAERDFNGKRMRTRFTWLAFTATTARWEQAYSYDDGKSWDTNWIMEFTRK